MKPNKKPKPTERELTLDELVADFAPEHGARQELERLRADQAKVPVALDALQTSQRALAVMTEPSAVRSTTVLNAYTMVLAAEARARSVIRELSEERS